MADVSLSKQDIDYISRVVATEVPSWIAARDPSVYQSMVQAVVDTITNRAASKGFPNNIVEVLNQDRAFSKIAGPQYLNPYGKVENAPKAPASIQSLVEQHITERALGKPSIIGRAVNYANPKASSANNLGWINDMIAAGATKLGIGNSFHVHGTAKGNIEPQDYAISYAPARNPSNMDRYGAPQWSPTNQIDGKATKSFGFDPLTFDPLWGAPPVPSERPGIPVPEQRPSDDRAALESQVVAEAFTDAVAQISKDTGLSAAQVAEAIAPGITDGLTANATPSEIGGAFVGAIAEAAQQIGSSLGVVANAAVPGLASVAGSIAASLGPQLGDVAQAVVGSLEQAAAQTSIAEQAQSPQAPGQSPTQSPTQAPAPSPQSVSQYQAGPFSFSLDIPPVPAQPQENVGPYAVSPSLPVTVDGLMQSQSQYAAAHPGIAVPTQASRDPNAGISIPSVGLFGQPSHPATPTPQSAYSPPSVAVASSVNPSANHQAQSTVQPGFSPLSGVHGNFDPQTGLPTPGAFGIQSEISVPTAAQPAAPATPAAQAAPSVGVYSPPDYAPYSSIHSNFDPQSGLPSPLAGPSLTAGVPNIASQQASQPNIAVPASPALAPQSVAPPNAAPISAAMIAPPALPALQPIDIPNSAISALPPSQQSSVTSLPSVAAVTNPGKADKGSTSKATGVQSLQVGDIFNPNEIALPPGQVVNAKGLPNGMAQVVSLGNPPERSVALAPSVFSPFGQVFTGLFGNFGVPGSRGPTGLIGGLVGALGSGMLSPAPSVTNPSMSYSQALAASRSGQSLGIGTGPNGVTGWGFTGEALSPGALGAGWVSNSPEVNYGGYGIGIDPTPV